MITEILEKIAQAARERRKWEAEEEEWKKRLIEAVKLQPPSAQVFSYTYGDVTVAVRRRSSIALGKPALLEAVLGERYPEVLVPDKRKVFEVCSSSPETMTKALMSGALRVQETEYVSVLFHREEEAPVQPEESDVAHATVQ